MGGQAGGGRTLRFTSHRNFRHRLLLAVLSQRSVHISSIRSNSENPGIADYEVSFLRLLERVTNGTTVEINYTGTEVLVRPGLVSGGTVVHTCPESRAVGWFLEPLLVLGLFGKKELRLTLKGVTSNARDVSVSEIVAQQMQAYRKKRCSKADTVILLLPVFLPNYMSMLGSNFLHVHCIYFRLYRSQTSIRSIRSLCWLCSIRSWSLGRHAPYILPTAPLLLPPRLCHPTSRATDSQARLTPRWRR